MTRALAAVGVLVLACSIAGCSALLDWNGFSGGEGDASTDGSVAADAGDHEAGGQDAPDTADSCGLTCQNAPPTGWTGPVALSVTASSLGAAPPCGAGFDTTPAFDGFADLTVASATCSACSCGAPTSITCNGPTISFFSDGICTMPSTPSSVTVSSTCTTLPFNAQDITVSAPTFASGTCPSSGGAPTGPAPTWGRIARACAPAVDPTGNGCASGQVCAPAPASPFSTRLCVMQAGAATTCPSAYPTGPQTFYSGADDARTCSACECSGPTGTQCTIGSPAINVALIPTCSGTISTLDAPSTCAALQEPGFVTLASPVTVSTPGTCTLTGGGSPSGTATASGATSFCCGL